MLESITELPPNIVGFRAVGEITAADYQDLLLPALNQAHHNHKKIRFLFQLGRDFTGFTGGAMLEDAVVGVQHYTHFERIAVVSDHESLRAAVHLFGFAVPASIRAFTNSKFDQAVAWLNHSDLKHEFLQDEGILILTPQGALAGGDFKQLASKVDPYLKTHESLKGLLIDGKSFAGWESFGALVAHLRFVRDYHTKIKRVAIVSDRPLLSTMPKLAAHFIAADFKHFPADARPDAFEWLRE